MSGRQLDVLVNEQLVGYLHEVNNLWQFDYAKPWIDAADGFDLSPALPRAAGRHVDGASHRPVQWYFDDLLPEEGLRSETFRSWSIRRASTLRPLTIC